MKIQPPEPTSLHVADLPPASSPPPSLTSIRERQALDTLINIGLLIAKKLEGPGVFRYYDARGELLLTKRLNQWGEVVYEVYKVGVAAFTDDLNYDQVPKLLVVTTTDARINIDLYLPGAWETRLTKLAEGKLNGKNEKPPRIKRAPRSPKKRAEG